MVVDWIKRWLAAPRTVTHLVSISRDQHSISRKNISQNALKVLNRLQKADYEAYLVGGCVRDLQLERQPNDFDIATSAKPEQVQQLFRNSRSIGRRFRIVHVLFGREVIEVTTFRGMTSNDENKRRESAEGMLLRDNVYGSLAEDALRRDFTVNAMYYRLADFSVTALTNSMSDLSKRRIRIIGDPESRYREDPIRMLRAVRFAAKLDFTIEPVTARPFRLLASLLTQVAPARLFDESLKLFMRGYAAAVWPLLNENELLSPLLPLTGRALQVAPDDCYSALIKQALINTDKRIKMEKPVTPAFLYAALLWPALKEKIRSNPQRDLPQLVVWQQAMTEVIETQLGVIAIPKRFTIPMREIWEFQLRLPKRRGAQAEKLVAHPRFRAAYDFLLLREQAGELRPGLGLWWSDYQNSDAEQRKTMVKSLNASRPPKPRRRRSRKPQLSS